MPDSLAPDLDEGRGDVVLLADPSVDGEDVASLLRGRGFVVLDVPLALLETRFASERPRVIVLDVDQPEAIERAERVLATPEARDVEIFCVGSRVRAAELLHAELDDHVFTRPLDVERLVERVVAVARPGARGTTPPPMYAPRPSHAPGPESVPPPSDGARLGDPLELGSLLEVDEEPSLLGTLLAAEVAMSPDLAARLAAAEQRVLAEPDRASNEPPSGEEGDVEVPADLLAPLEEGLDAGDDPMPSTGGDGTGAAAAALSSSGAGTGTGHGLAGGTGIGSAGTGTGTGTGTGIGTGIGLLSPGTSAGVSASEAPARVPTATGVGALLPLEGGDAASPSQHPLPSAGAPVTTAGLPPFSGVPQPSIGHAPVSSAASLAPTTPPPRAPASAAPDAGTQVGLGASPPLRTGGPLRLGDAPGSEPAHSPRAASPAVGYRVGEMLGLRAPASAATPPLPPAHETMRGDHPALLAAIAPVRFQEPRALGEGRAMMDLRHGEAPPAPAPHQPRPVTTTTSPFTFQPGSAPASGSVHVSPAASSVATPGKRETSSQIPMVFGEGEGARPIARAIATRVTGSLAVSTPAGVRRIVLQEGDVVTAGSEIADESLVVFLAGRGDLDRDAAARLAGKLPASGRHAGAALIAQGFVAQDELWRVLRAHAEWLVGRAMTAGPGSVELESEPPGRLKAEPSVFGGATGAEVFVEIARRVLPPRASLGALGGPEARVDAGPRAALLAECALPQHEADVVRHASGRALRDLAPDPEDELVSVLRALVDLEVLAVHAPAQVATSDRRARPDPLDDEAIRKRVAARLALVRDGDYFSLLGVAPDATSYEIKRAYLELRRELEPARLLTPGTVDLDADLRLVIEVLDEAYDVLRDTPRRERYRKAIAAGPP